MIAAALLLSTMITILGGRYVGLESPTDDTAGSSIASPARYQCQAPTAARR